MAKAKKKSNVKKTASNKAASTKSKKSTATSSKKGVKATAPAGKKTNKIETKHVSEKVDNKQSNPWMIVSFILMALIVLLVAGISAMYYNNTTDVPQTNTTDENNTEEIVATDAVTLTIIEDPTCVNCQVDLFASQIKENLISNLEVEKISYDSDEGKAIIATLNAKQVPIYLFSKNIDEREDWAEQLQGAFFEQNINGENLYFLNPDLVQGKVMIEEPVALESSIIIGDENAPITIIQFTDYECPFCAIADGNPQMVEEFQARSPGYVAPMPEVYKNYVESGKVKVVFNNFPIASLHPKARETHNAALCANEQEMFEEYSHQLWMDRETWTGESDRDAIYKKYAKDLGLDETQFNECLDTNKYDSQIEAELAYGQSLGVSGTPAFYIGKTFISGAQDYATFESIIEAELEALN